MKTLDLKTAAETAMAKEGRYALSFWTLPDVTADALALRVALQLNRQGGSFRVSTVGRMAEAGFDLVDLRADGHCAVLLAGVPTEEDCEALRAPFDAPIPNPYRR
jgi:hypothetical protein